VVLWRWNQQVASLILLVGSFLLFLKSYRKPWRLRWYTCLLPAAAALGGYLFQVVWFNVHKPIGPMGAGIIVGAVIGILRGRGHRLEVKKQQIYAHRTIVVLLLWLLTYLLTQSSALLGRPELAEWGLTGGAFTTTIVVFFSAVLLIRYRSKNKGLSVSQQPSRPPQTVAVGMMLFLASAVLFTMAVPAEAAAPKQVTVDGEWELDRREHDACQLLVPPVIGGDIHIEANFEAGTVEGWLTGSGAGSYTMPATCDTEKPTPYDFDTEETWTAELSNIQADFGGTLDKQTGAFEFDIDIYVETYGERSAAGHQYMCGTDYWTPTCILPEVDTEQLGTISGVIRPTGFSEGEIDWYTAYCALINPGQIPWGSGDCQTIGDWEGEVTEVVWLENRPPEIAGLGAAPADPTSEDTVVFSVTAADPDGDELTYTWYFDGVIDPASGPQANWRKPPPGDHEIEVDVSDGVETVDSFLDLRVSEHVGGPDQDDDGVPDDEDRCPTEWGSGDDGCPEFAAAVNCAPARPMPEESVTCGVRLSGKHVGETFVYEWYVDGGNVQSGATASWTWAKPTEGVHEVLVDVTGEGRSATGSYGLDVTGGIVDAETAGFSLSAIGCNSGITGDEILGCSATIARSRDDVGMLSVTWILDGQPIATEATEGSSTGWSLDGPPAGDHVVQVVAVDPVTNLGQAGSVVINIRPSAADLEDAAAAAALATGIGLLLAGTGLSTLANVSAALAGMTPDQIAESIRHAVETVPELIDPRDGAVLQVDGDRVYWDDDTGWIDRATAQDWITELAVQRIQRDQATEQTWAQIQQDRDDYYQQRQWDIESSVYRWDPDRQAYVHPMWLQRPAVPTIEQVYQLQDLIDDNAHLLTDRMQLSVHNQLNQLDFRPGHVNQEDFDRLRRVTQAVADSATGYRWASQAAADLQKIDRLEDNMQVRAFLTNFGTGVVRFAVSRVDPTQGLLTGALFGYLMAPEGSGIKNAVIGAVCTYVDVAASNLSASFLQVGGRTIQLTGRSHILWNASTGAFIGGTEQALYGGSWEDIKRGALFGGAANGVFAGLQKPTIQRWVASAETGLTSRLSVLEQDLVIRPGSGVTLEPPAPVRPAGGVGEGGLVRPAGGADEGPVRPAAGDEGMARPAAEPEGAVRPTSPEAEGTRPVRAAEGEAEAAGPRPATDDGDAGRPRPDQDPYADLPPIEETFPTRGPLPDSAYADAPRRPGATVTDNTIEAWTARDRQLGVQREQLVPMGFEEPPEFVKQNQQLTWLTQVDDDIRRVWQEVGGGREANSWNRFVNSVEQRIQNGDLPPEHVNRWFQMFDESMGASQPSGFIKGTPAPGDMDANLIPGYLNRAIASDNPADQLAPLANGGRRNLGLWEERGVITGEQAAAFNSRMSSAVDQSVTRSTPEAVRRFQAETGVEVNQTLAGDSGSSAGRGSRSVGGTDNDRTFVPEFDEGDVLSLARDRYPDLPADQAIARTHQELTETYSRHHAEAAAETLHSNYGINPQEAGFNVYNGISNPRAAGPVDIYGAGTVRTLAAVGGRTNVIQPDGTSYRTSGDALVDAEHLQRSRYGWADEPTGPYSDVRRMTDADYHATLQEQVAQVQSLNPANDTVPQLASAAKNVQRAADAGQRLGAQVMDPEVVAVANRLRADPQSAPQILADAGMTRRTFVERAQSNVLRQADAVYRL
jgi:membrane protein CcdC involved in cytochrome C biogenesis